MKKTILFAMLFLSIPTSVFASKDAVLEFSPKNQKVEVGKKYTADVYVVAGNNKLAAVDLKLVWDPNIVTIESIEQGDFMPVLLLPGQIDGAVGKISVGVSPKNPLTGRGKIATLTYKIKSQVDTTTVSISNESKVASLSESTSVLQKTDTLSITTGDFLAKPLDFQAEVAGKQVNVILIIIIAVFTGLLIGAVVVILLLKFRNRSSTAPPI